MGVRVSAVNFVVRGPTFDEMAGDWNGILERDQPRLDPQRVFAPLPGVPVHSQVHSTPGAKDSLPLKLRRGVRDLLHARPTGAPQVEGVLAWLPIPGGREEKVLVRDIVPVVRPDVPVVRLVLVLAPQVL